jgi:hypothetical protein
VLIGKHKGHNCVGSEEGISKLKKKLGYMLEIAEDHKQELKGEIAEVKEWLDFFEEVANGLMRMRFDPSSTRMRQTLLQLCSTALPDCKRC